MTAPQVTPKYPRSLPLNSRTPICTNQSGTFGECSVTNVFTAGVPQQYFRVRTP